MDPVYEGQDNRFSAVVDRAALRVRVQAIGTRRGNYAFTNVQAPTIIIAPDTVAPTSFRDGLKDYVMEQIGQQNRAINFMAQQIANLSTDQDAANYIDKRVTRNILSEQIGDVQVAITETAQIATDLNGRIAAAWFLSINNDGYVSGMYQYNNGDVADFAVIADNFLVASPALPGQEPTTIFTVSEVDGEARIVIKGDLFADGSIRAQAIAVDELSAISVNAGRITAGRIESTDGLCVFDLTAGNFIGYEEV